MIFCLTSNKILFLNADTITVKLLPLLFIFLFLGKYSLSSQGIFNQSNDVGEVKITGKTMYNEQSQSYTLVGSGSNIWFDKDEFHYSWKYLTGDFILQARGVFIDTGGDPHRKFGWMVRTEMTSSAAMINASVHGDGLSSFQFRRFNGDSIQEVRTPILHPDVIQLERKGGRWFLSVARSGDLFWTVEVPDIYFPETLMAGLFVCSHQSDREEKVLFDNVRIVIPPNPRFVPYKDYLGSHIETVEIKTGNRSIVYSENASLQAPNWLLNNSGLIYNKKGYIYKYDFKTATNSVLPTDTIVKNNNDHVISFDGKMLGLSSSSGEAKYGSLIYTVPIEGGKPVRITETGPSYLHGWSPNGKWLTFTGQRNKVFDIYVISSKGGKEKRLTVAEGLDDGSEYSPDGKFIYFNSSRTGKMQLWRMTAKGKNQTQLTFDAYNNWFPHISPDGKWILFLTYPPDIRADDHPFYKHVYLRIMPVDGSQPPRVLTYLFGGQGTINTPSWSPDGTKVAFVSNTGM
ncbi:MAG: hypothetical protein RLZZ417_626 [Bacteroidota bacterium]|jgi:TolB protein